MANINESLFTQAPKPVDGWYCVFESGAARPYSSLAEVLSIVPSPVRTIGQTFLVTVSGVTAEYWYFGGLADINLVKKVTAVTSVALSIGTAGTDITVSGSPLTSAGTITLNVPTASASNRGLLSSTNWSTFNNKQDALVSGTTIKTIDDQSILGSGNLRTKNGAVPFNNDSIFLGDSITVGYAAEGAQVPWASIVSSELSIAPLNLATNSTGVRWAYYRGTQNGGVNSFKALAVMAGFNDMRTSDSSTLAIRLQTLLAGSRAIAAYQFTKSIQFYIMGTSGAVNPNITTSLSGATATADIDTLNDSGSRANWFRQNDPSNTTVNWWRKNSITTNETVTITNVGGSAIAIGTWGVDGVVRNWSRFSVTVDGVSKGTYNPNGKSYTGNGAGFFTAEGIQNDAFIITGLIDTPHTVLLTFLDGGKPGGFDYVATLKSAVESVPAPLYMLDIPHMNSIGYATGITTEADLDNATAARKTELDTVLPGYPVIFVPTNKYYNPLTAGQISSDGIHPLTPGQQNIAKAVIETIDGSKSPKLNLNNIPNGVTVPKILNIGTINTKYVGLELSGTIPRTYYNDVLGSAANNRGWDMYANANTFTFRAINDANNAESNVFRIYRSGAVITNTLFENGSFSIGALSSGEKFHVTGDARITDLATGGADQYIGATTTGHLKIMPQPVSVNAPRLTTSSIAGYVWTATDTAGNGSWQVATGGGGGGGSSVAPITINTSGNTTYALPANKVITMILIKPVNADNIKIGTTAGGEDIMEETAQIAGTYAGNGLRPDYVTETAKTVYFTGITGATVIKIYTFDLI